jgi:outer membrane immunogenic protein
MKSRVLLALLGLCVSSAVVAAPVLPLKEQPMYWGVGYSWIDYSEDAWNDEASLGALTGRLGYQYSDMISGEVRYSRGVRDDSFSGVQVDLDHMYGIYGKVNLLTDVDFSPYAILGYTQGEATGFLAGAASASQKEHGVSYGVGVDLCRDQPVCMQVEYMSYVDKDNFQASGMLVGLKVRF